MLRRFSRRLEVVGFHEFSPEQQREPPPDFFLVFYLLMGGAHHSLWRAGKSCGNQLPPPNTQALRLGYKHLYLLKRLVGLTPIHFPNPPGILGPLPETVTAGICASLALLWTGLSWMCPFDQSFKNHIYY